MFKTRLEIFGNDFRLFCNFEKFLIFLKIFDNSTLQGRLGKKNFSKKSLKTCSKHVWTLLGTTVDIFFESFWFFWKFSKTRPTMEHWAKKLSKKLPQNMFKTRLDTYGNDFGFVWNFGKFLIFLKIFEDPPWNTEKNFRKNYPKTCSKHVWTLMGTILGLFGILENFWKKIFEEIAQNIYKTRLDSFGNDCGQFWTFESFLKKGRLCLKIFEDSTLHRTLGKKKLRKM